MAEVVLKGVSKSFGTTQAVRDVSMTVPDGAFVVLLGPTGAGKTTTLRLIAGLEDVTSGQIRIDGQPITMIKQRALRAQIGVVLQEPLLFQGSIASNIAYGHPEATRQQIIEAARAAKDEDMMALVTSHQKDLVARQVDVSTLLRFRESVLQAGLKPPVRVLGQPHLLCDAVGRLEADAPNVLGQTIGIVADDGCGIRAVCPVDPGRQLRGQAEGLQR